MNEGAISRAQPDLTRVTPLISWALTLVLWLSGPASAADTGAAGASSGAARDFTCLLFSDTHVGAENLKATPPLTQADTQAKLQANLDSMRGLIGRPYPPRPEATGFPVSKVAPPRGLLILGDLVDGHKEPARQQAQWQAFDGLFPALGVAFGRERLPVFALAGNHDGDPAGPLRQGLVQRNRQLQAAGWLAAISENGVHFALNWDGVHLVFLTLCPADTTDAQTPFKYGQPGKGSWNDPQGALAFLADYLRRQVGRSGAPVILLQHYGFDGFSLNDWNWWTPRQRRALYDLIRDYNIVALCHGHDHHADHYRWPDPQRHAQDVAGMFPEGVPASLRQYDILSCGNICWVLHVQGDRFQATHFRGPDWASPPSGFLEKSLKP